MPQTGRFSRTMGGAVCGIDRAEAPADARGILDGRDERERNLAIEDRVADRVRRRADADARGGGGLRSRADADDRHLGVARLASPLDLGPVFFRRAPARLRRREPQHLVRGAEPQQHHPARDALGLVAPDEGRGDDLGRKERLVEGIRDREAAGRLARKRERRRPGIPSRRRTEPAQRRARPPRGPPARHAHASEVDRARPSA